MFALNYLNFVANTFLSGVARHLQDFHGCLSPGVKANNIALTEILLSLSVHATRSQFKNYYIHFSGF
jgi:hypothetical protein